MVRVRVLMACGVAVGAVVLALTLLPSSKARRSDDSVLPRCPSEARVPLPDRNPRAQKVLAPSGAVAMRVCVYPSSNTRGTQSQQVVRRDATIRQITRRLNRLQRMTHPDVTTDKAGDVCPDTDGPRALVFFSYRRQSPVGVDIQTAGCWGVTNCCLGMGGAGRSAVAHQIFRLGEAPGGRLIIPEPPGKRGCDKRRALGHRG